MTRSMLPRFALNGRPVTGEALMPLVQSNYGHFTAMQVRGGATRGFGFHLERLDSATRELFGQGLDGDRVRAGVRGTLGDLADAAVRVTVFRPDDEPEVSVLVTVRPPAGVSRTPQAMMSAPYLRPVPHLKHIGGFGQAYWGRRARAAGFDDALLTGPDGVIAESAVANVCFLDGDRVVWPDTPHLTGIGMRVLERELAVAGIAAPHRTVRLTDVGSFDGALVVNSRGITQLARVDDTTLPTGSPLAGRLLALFDEARRDRV